MLDGVVVTRAAVVGQGVDAGAKVLTIGDFSTVQIEGEVPESLVDGLVAAGTPSVRVRRSNDGGLAFDTLSTSAEFISGYALGVRARRGEEREGEGGGGEGPGGEGAVSGHGRCLGLRKRVANRSAL